MSCHVHYRGSPTAERAIVRALTRRGFRRSRDAATATFQWCSHSTSRWCVDSDASAAPPCLTACFPIRTAFSSKSALAALAAHPVVTNDATCIQCPPSWPLRDWLDGEEVERTLAAACREWSTQSWVLKASCSNNAESIVITHGSCLRASLSRRAHDAPTAAPRDGIVQSYVPSPLLFAGRKFHLRVNVLLTGDGSIAVHRDMVAHVATSPWLSPHAGSDDAAAHITNHCFQRGCVGYVRGEHTLLLQDLIARVAAGAQDVCTHLQARIATAVSRFIQHALVLCGPGRTEAALGRLLITPDAFELFGCDVMLSRPSAGCDGDDLLAQWRTCTPVLLEVNVGPAMEGEAMPRLCERLVDDVLDVVLDVHPPCERRVAAGSADDAWIITTAGRGRFLTDALRAELQRVMPDDDTDAP